MKIGGGVVLCLTIFLAGMLPAANSAIGVAVANGEFLLDRSPVVGNANIFNGSAIETEKAMSDLALNNGLKIRLGTQSRGTVFSDRLVLEKGAGQVTGPHALIAAGRLRITPIGASAIARVAYGSRNLVEVAAIGGPLRVETAEGIPVANMTSGTALRFEEQAGAAAPTRLTGKVERTNGKLMLTDKTSNVTVELQGTGLEQYVGKTVTVTGNMVGTDALQVLTIGNAAGAAAGAGAGAGAGGGGLSTAAIAGIAIAGGAGLGLGLAAAAGAFSSGSVSK